MIRSVGHKHGISICSCNLLIPSPFLNIPYLLSISVYSTHSLCIMTWIPTSIEDDTTSSWYLMGHDIIHSYSHTTSCTLTRFTPRDPAFVEMRKRNTLGSSLNRLINFSLSAPFVLPSNPQIKCIFSISWERSRWVNYWDN